MTLPGGNAACKIVDLLETFAGENLSSGPAASACRSVSDYRFLRVQFFKSVIQRGQGYQLAAGYASRFVFFWLPYIEQGKTTRLI
jgi:hypothetical protein